MNYRYYPLALLLIASFVLAPAITSAKEKSFDSRPKEKIERYEKKCLKAFGHLIAPGFIKHHGKIEADNCQLPFGIWKKLEKHGTTTADVIAPILSSLEIQATTTSTTLSWQTNENTRSQVYFGTTNPLNLSASSTFSTSDYSYRKVHTVTLVGLNASSSYYFLIKSQDKSGNIATSSQGMFVTR